MKSAAVVVSVVLAAVANANPLLQQRAGCNADNCARAVTGTNVIKPPPASRQADCSSFQLATVSPARVTVTSTFTPAPVEVDVTATTYTTVVVPTTTASIFIGDPAAAAAAAKRQVTGGDAVTITPTAVPAYASACSGTARYASACSCGGITRTTTTLPTPTTTVTVTIPPSTFTETVLHRATTTVGTAVTSNIVPGPRPSCGSTIQGTGDCKCTYKVTCNAQYTGGRIIETRNLLSELDCITACDHYDNCFNVDYNRRTGACRVFQRADGAVDVDDDDVFAFAGVCGTNGDSPNCIIG